MSPHSHTGAASARYVLRAVSGWECDASEESGILRRYCQCHGVGLALARPFIHELKWWVVLC
eukprot:3191556-Prymnesium_polylepis.2